MAISDEQYKALIITEVKDDGNVVADNIDLYWSMYEDRATKHLQYLYAKKRAILLLVGHHRKEVTVILRGGDVQTDLNNQIDALMELYNATSLEIDTIEAGGESATSGWGRTLERA